MKRGKKKEEMGNKEIKAYLARNKRQKKLALDGEVVQNEGFDYF